MKTAADVLDNCLSFAPASWKEDWDNVGLLCGRPEREVTAAVVALDVTAAVANEAISNGAELIVSHHPLLFSVRSLSGESAQGRLLLTLAAHDIAVICLHTNLDSAPGGVNDVLAQQLRLKNIRTLTGETRGIGRCGEVPEQTLPDFAALVKARLCAGCVRYADGGRPVHQVAVGGGSCMDFIEQVRAAHCDTFVTADIKYHQFQQASALGVNLIDAGHFPTENLICDALCRRLGEAFPEISFRKSAIHADCIRYL